MRVGVGEAGGWVGEGVIVAVRVGGGVGDVGCQARVTAFVREGLNNATLTPATAVNTITLTPGTGPAFQAAQVQVTLDDRFLLLGPLVSLVGGNGGPFGTIALRATSTMRVETTATGS